LNRTIEIHSESPARLHLDTGDIHNFVLTCLDEHTRLLSGQTKAVLKNAPESAVTMVSLSGFPRVCVKEFRWRGWIHALKGLFRPTQGVRTFKNGWRLQADGIGVAAPLALVREKSLGLIRSEWIVMEAIPDALELDRFVVKRIVSRWTAEERRGMVRMFGRFIGSMHAKGIFHSDLKTCNVLVSEDAPKPENFVNWADSALPASFGPIRFSLLDYDDVRFANSVAAKKITKNLVQIFLSTPAAIGAADRLRFLSEYTLHVGMARRERREIALKVLLAAKGKEILYVGFDGDVRERWE
jgi:tRNA A-37 threonylcarbamoyl transferase component Bud32